MVSRRLFLLTPVLLSACADSTSRPGGDEPPVPGEFPFVLVEPANSGAGQVAPVASYLAHPLVVRVTRAGEPVSGVPVRWGSGNPSARIEPLSDTSDVNGYVSARFFTATTAGDQSAIAILGNQWLGLRVRATAGPPTRLRSVSAINDSIPPLFAMFLTLRIEDRFGNGVPEAAADWSVVSAKEMMLGYLLPSDKDGYAQRAIVFMEPASTAVVTVTLPEYGAVDPLTFFPHSFGGISD